MAEDWTKEEVVVTISDYFDMLVKELSGETYNKSAHARNIQNLLNNRSTGAIEFKRQNISAVLIELGLPYIYGYKPLPNYQNLLKNEVVNYLNQNRRLEALFDEFVRKDAVGPKDFDLSSLEVDVPEFEINIGEPTESSTYRSSRNYYREELRNRSLGLSGEEFILKLEKRRLIEIGKDDLASKVEHISQTVGDMAGFDVLSFEADGIEKYIEVKTTRMGKEAPFYYTRNELSFSRREHNRYSLYRLFNFENKPQYYHLKGSLDQNCKSVSMEFMAWPK